MDGPVVLVQIWICSILGHLGPRDAWSWPANSNGACGSLSIRSETLQGWAGSNHQLTAGAGQTQCAGSMVLLQTAALSPVPFFPRGGLTDLNAFFIQ